MKRFHADDMKHITYVSWPMISADASLSACVKYHGDEATGDFPSKVCVIDSASGDEVYVTEDGHSEKQPFFCGSELFFLSDESGEWQVWSCSIGQNENSARRQVTTLRHGVNRYAVSSDGTGIAYEATLWPEEITEGTWNREMGPEEKTAWNEELDWRPYVATELVYKMDEWYGMRKGEYSHIGICDAYGSCARILDSDGVEVIYPAWSPDGQAIACMAYPHDGAKGRQAEAFYAELHAKCDEAVSGKYRGEFRQLTDGIGIYADHAPLFTDDGQTVIAGAYPSFDDYSTIELPVGIDINTGETRYIIDEDSDEICHGVHPVALGRSEFGDNAYYMTVKGGYLYFQSFNMGRGGVYRVSLEDNKAIEKMYGEGDVHSFAISDDGTIACTIGSFYEPPELYAGGRRVTFSNDWLSEYELGEVQAFTAKSRDGEADIQYWICYPPDYDPEAKYPAVLDAKGGPETCYGESFWHEFQSLASEGLVVLYGNPRGSVGYGRKFNSDIICWKTPAMEDHLAIVDDAIARGIVDPAHVGVTGGSYGGYMTIKLIGRTDAFTAAVAQRALANPVTSYGTGDMGFVSAGGSVSDDFRMYDYLVDRAKDNSITHVDDMKTPLLILHASHDFRCGFEQAEQIFIPMKERNPEIPLRLVRFPGENHGLTRTGKLHYQIRHLRELVGWFRKYLIDEPWERVDTGAKYNLACLENGADHE